MFSILCFIIIGVCAFTAIVSFLTRNDYTEYEFRDGEVREIPKRP